MLRSICLWLYQQAYVRIPICFSRLAKCSVEQYMLSDSSIWRYLNQLLVVHSIERKLVRGRKLLFTNKYGRKWRSFNKTFAIGVWDDLQCYSRTSFAIFVCYTSSFGDFSWSLLTMVLIRCEASFMITEKDHSKRLSCSILIRWYTTVYDRE